MKALIKRRPHVSDDKPLLAFEHLCSRRVNASRNPVLVSRRRVLLLLAFTMVITC